MGNLLPTLGYSNIILMLTNIIFFMIVQTLFFIFIAAKQYDVILKEKINFVNEFNDNLEDYKFINIIKTIIGGKYNTLASNQENNRNSKNIKSFIKFILPFILIIFTILCIYVFLIITSDKNDWKPYHYFILGTILFAFSTELFYFFFIVKRYVMVGDSEMLYKIFYTIKQSFKNINNGNCSWPNIKENVKEYFQ
jgi:hypothetical protein